MALADPSAPRNHPGSTPAPAVLWSIEREPMSKPLVVVIPHQLGQAGARQRLETGIEAAKSKFAAYVTSVDANWTENHLDVLVKAMGQSVNAGLDVGESDVRVEVHLPWMLAMIAEKAKAMIQKEGQLLLENKKTS